MKKITLFLLIVSISCSFGQSGAKWATDLNSINNGDVFGTNNNFPLLFHTNNTLKMTLGTNGILNLNSLGGIGNRVLLTDANGSIIALPQGSNSQVLFGDGTWGNLPSGAGSWGVSGNHIFNTNSGNIGIGTNNPMTKLDINGDVHIQNNLYVDGQILITDRVESGTISTDTIRADTGSIVIGDTKIINKFEVGGNSSFGGNLKITSLAGIGDREVVVDALGNLKIPSFAGMCFPNAPRWSMGGDNIATLITTTTNDGSIGTCDFTDFVLKSNNIKLIWLKPSGKVGIGTSNPLEFFQIGDRFTIHNGGTKYIGYNSYFDFSTSQNKRLVSDYASVIATNGAQMSFELAGNASAGSSISFVPAIRMLLNPLNPTVPQVWIGDKRQTTGSHTDFRFAVDGKIVAKEIIVTQQNWADYVFSKNYKLMSLFEVEQFIQENSHLPNIPSAKEVKENGLNTGLILNKQMEKIEEITLYMIEMKKEIIELRKENIELKNILQESKNK